MEDTKETNASVIRDLAAGLSEVSTAADGARPFTILPVGYSVHDLEKTLPRPLAIRATPTLKTLTGLIAYIEGFKGNETAIFANPETGRVVAVIDYHGAPAVPSWCSHQPSYTPENTVEWNRWKSNDDKWLEQRAFAEFIENNVADIVKPSGATMLEIAQTLEAKTAVEFKSGVRLDNGSTKLHFANNVEAKAGEKGDISIPPMIELAVAPFRGGDAYPLVARFRYKIAEGKLTLRYQLVNPHKVIESAVDKMIETVATGTGIAPFIGQP